MKFMKLGSKPDSFQNDGENIRYVASELATDIVVNVGDVKFYLHKFPLLSKSARLQKLVTNSNDDNSDEIYIQAIPGGPAVFEICAKFCYGMTVTLNAYNVVAARCAAEYLEMYETIEKGNLIYKIEVFLNFSVLRSWKDSIITLQTTKYLLPWSEKLKVVSHCLDSIATKASIDTSKVEWSYSYNRKKLPTENGKDPRWNNVKANHMVPKDWWVEDLCELHVDLYKRIIKTIKSEGNISGPLIGEALTAYTMRQLPGFSKGIIQCDDLIKNRSLVETIVWLLPLNKGSASSAFLLKLFKTAILLECGEPERRELMKRIGQQLEEATVADLLIRASTGETTTYDVDIVRKLVEEFLTQEQGVISDCPLEKEFEIRSPRFVPDASKARVAKLVDAYLTEIARDRNLPLLKFVDLAETVSSFPRPSHDGIYRSIDMYLKEHPGISKSERKRICRLMDCKKLTAEGCSHAIQNERLPLRVVVQILFFEQMRTTTPVGISTPDLPGFIKALLPGGSYESSRSGTTNTEEEWDSVPTSEEIRALKSELATLRSEAGDGHRSSNCNTNNAYKSNAENIAAGEMKGLHMSNIFSKLWSNKDRNGEISPSDTSESLGSGSVNADEKKSTLSSRRQLTS